MGSDLHMHPPVLTREEKERIATRISQEEKLAQVRFKQWYSETVAPKDDPYRILDAWRAFWEGYNYHKNLGNR